jgi:multidrug resistance efflux pump
LIRAAAVFVFAVAGVIAVLYWQYGRTGPAVVTGFVEADQIRVGSRVGGRVAEVMVEEGDRVQQGQPLFRIDEFDLGQRLAEAQAQLAAHKAELDRLQAGFRQEEVAQAAAKRDQAQATLDKLVAGPRPAEINIAREQVRIAEANVDLAQTEYERLSRLREEDSAAKVELDEAVKTLKESRAQLAAANEQLQLLEEGTRQEELAEARAALAEAAAAFRLVEAGYRAEDIAQAAAQASAVEATVNAIKTQMEELIVESPCDCLVEATDLRPGDLVAANAPAVSLLDLSRMWVRTYVPHGMLHRVRLGQRLPIRMDSFPDRGFSGEVVFIAGEAEFTPRNIQTPEERSKQVFRVKLRLDEGRDLLHVGMAADVLLDGTPGTEPRPQGSGE